MVHIVYMSLASFSSAELLNSPLFCLHSRRFCVYVCVRNASNVEANAKKVIKQFGRFGVYDSGRFCCSRTIVLTKNENGPIHFLFCLFCSNSSPPRNGPNLARIVHSHPLCPLPRAQLRPFRIAHLFCFRQPTIFNIQPHSIAMDCGFMRQTKSWQTRIGWNVTWNSADWGRASERNQSIDGK